MLAVWCDWSGGGTRLNDRIAVSLGLFAGRPASYHRSGSVAFAQQLDPRSRPRRGWRPSTTRSGLRILFNGYLDNAAQLAGTLGLPATAAPGEIYGAAVERWSDAADFHCIGVYCAACVNEAGDSLRLARSPYDAPPIHYFWDRERTIAASVPRVIFAAGITAQLNRRRVIRNLVYHVDEADNWYEGLKRVPLGTVVTLDRSAARSHRFYDPEAFVGSGHPDGDAPQRAYELLREGAAAVHRDFSRPGMLLSGGLDSPLAAVALLDVMPAQQRLPTFTFTPCAAWDGELAEGMMGDERPLVQALAEQHPRLDPQFFPNEGVEFDHRWPDLFLATGGAAAGLPNMYMYHALWRAAVERGCDGIASAEFGNLSYSSIAPWACGEFLRTGQWRQLAKSLTAPRGDHRSLFKRFIALGVLPNLAPGLVRLSDRLRGKGRSPTVTHYSALNPRLISAPEACDDEGRPLDPFAGPAPRNHRKFVRDWMSGEGEASDVHQGFEQLYGLRRRDVTAYRPLIEFCLGLPTREFEWNGQDRRLARRMGIGRVPDAIRTNWLYGRHGVDWHARMGPKRESLIAELRGYRGDPFMAELLDLDRAIDALEHWPERTGYAGDELGPRLGVVTRAALTARFVNFIEGRNDL